jgi:alpha/beta superfamily hydrolase
VVYLEFETKQFDGPYEVSEIQINNIRGILYFPPKSFKKPYPLTIYFHGFPQLFPLIEIIKRYNFILDVGFALMVFNFSGYRLSEGKVSISNQVSDALEIIKFVKKMALHNLFTLNDINIIAHDFGAYIALILSSKIRIINKLLLISPILDLNKKVNNENFRKALQYINRFLPGNVQGIENVNEFILMTKSELSQKEFQIDRNIKKLKNKKLKVVIGEIDKITSMTEVISIFQESNITPEIAVIKGMDHEYVEEKEFEDLKEEILKFFRKIK